MHEECVTVTFDASCSLALKRFFDFLGLDVKERRKVFDPVAGIFDTHLHVTAKPEVDFKTLAARLAAAQSTQSAPTVSDLSDPNPFKPRRRMRSDLRRRPTTTFDITGGDGY